MKNYLEFSYPIKYIHNWSFEWPWNIYGGWINWSYYKWTGQNKEKTTQWDGIIILGFKKIVVKYICDEKTARAEYKKGIQRLNNFLMELIENKDNTNKLDQ